MATIEVSFGQYLRGLRRERGLSQQVVADRSGIDVSYLSKLENSKVEHTPSIKALLALAAALETDELEMLERANKLPQSFGAAGRSKVAMQFLRRANELISDDAGWQDLLDYLERKSLGV